MPWFLVSFGNFVQNSLKCVHSCCSWGIISSSQLRADQSLYLLLLLLLMYYSCSPWGWTIRSHDVRWNGKVYEMEKKKKKESQRFASRARLLRPERNFVLICRKVRLVRYMSGFCPALWSRSASAGVSPCWRRRWWEKRSTKLRPVTSKICARIFSWASWTKWSPLTHPRRVSLWASSPRNRNESPIITTGNFLFTISRNL